MAGGDGAVLERFNEDTPFYAEHCLRIVNEDTELVPFRFRRGQLKVNAARAAQARAGKPERVIVLKSRRVGISSGGVAEDFKRITLRANRRCQIVAQDNDTSGELFDLADVMYKQLPDERALKPLIVSRRASLDRKLLSFANNSRMTIDTAKEVQAGRGKTITDLHCTEVAFWPDPRKALSLLNAVIDRPGTFILLESTANGHNAWKGRWDRAEKGLGGFVPVFIGWLEDEKCWLEPEDEQAAERFWAEEYGRGDYGADEPRLVEKFGAKLEQLLWRRNAVVDKCDGNLSFFKQEYPTTALEAFVGSGRHVFSIAFIEDAEAEAEACNPPPADPEAPPGSAAPGDGILVAKGYRRRELMNMTVEVPTGTLWLPASATDLAAGKEAWRVWQHPVTDEAEQLKPEEDRRKTGQYVVFADVATGAENVAGDDPDWHAVQVIDHISGEQVAEFVSRTDRDVLAQEILLAALYFNNALVAVETTGGLGVTVVEILWKRYGYRHLYRRRTVGQVSERRQRIYGWDTTRKTKPAMEGLAAELLREGSHGIRSLRVTGELKTYVKHDDGKHGADSEAHDDALMAWMGARRVADIERPRIVAGAGEGKAFSSLPGSSRRRSRWG